MKKAQGKSILISVDTGDYDAEASMNELEEPAQLKYLLPRLTGKGTSLSRLGGGHQRIGYIV